MVCNVAQPDCESHSLRGELKRTVTSMGKPTEAWTKGWTLTSMGMRAWWSPVQLAARLLDEAAGAVEEPLPAAQGRGRGDPDCFIYSLTYTYMSYTFTPVPTLRQTLGVLTSRGR